MSLTGTLEELGLPDVVLLIARSKRSGLLRVSEAPAQGRGLRGQLFFLEGTFTYATTRSEDTLVGDLVRMGLVDEEAGTRLERRVAGIQDVLEAQADRLKLAEFLEEQIKEVLARLLRLERGRFEFQDGARPKLETGQALDVEEMLRQAEIRLARWREIEDVIPSPVAPLRMVSRPPMEEVRIDPLAWSLLAALGPGAGVQEVARRLGMWEFPAAKTLARLLQEGLVELVDEAGAPDVEAPEEEVGAHGGAPEEEEVGAHGGAPEEEEVGAHDSAPEDEEEPAAEEEVPEEDEEEEEEEVTSDLMRRWKQLRSRDGRSVG